MEKLYSIQEVSQLLGIPKDTLRYYDRIGIVSPSREDNRYRRYSKNDLIDLMNIQIMQYADFTLDEIKGTFGFHRMENVDPAYCREVASFFDAKKAETRKKIAHLEKVSQLLDVAAETLRTLIMKATNGWQKSFASFTGLFARRNREYPRRDVMGIKVRNFYFLIAGILAILFAFSHAWNGQSAVLPMLHVSAIAMDTRTVFMYVWHIITAENLVFGIVFIFMSFQSERLKIRYAAWTIEIGRAHV